MWLPSVADARGGEGEHLSCAIREIACMRATSEIACMHVCHQRVLPPARSSTASRVQYVYNTPLGRSHTAHVPG